MKKYRNIILLLTSVIIYVYINLTGLIFITSSLVITYLIGKTLEHEKIKGLLVLGIGINLIILLKFKILINIDSSILVPLGISYYTLQIISYLVDTYQGKIKNSSFLNFSLYIFYIPCLFIGPINRYNDFLKNLDNVKITKDNLYNGILRIEVGLFKKLVIAGRINIIINTILKNNYSGSYVLLACLLYTILLYSDFSGGVDIVLGVSKIFNIDLKENFDKPLFSESVKEFWNRWHITLSSFLKDYVYIPLKGNRCSKIRQKINILITFIVSGLWHGINYILWGIGQGILVIINLKTKNKVINILFTYLLISLLWIFFIYPDNIVALKKLVTIFTTFKLKSLINNIFNLGLNFKNFLVLIISTLMLLIIDYKKDTLKNINISLEKKLVINLTLFLLILVFGVYGIGFEVDEFIYSRF